MNFNDRINRYDPRIDPSEEWVFDVAPFGVIVSILVGIAFICWLIWG